MIVCVCLCVLPLEEHALAWVTYTVQVSSGNYKAESEFHNTRAQLGQVLSPTRQLY